MPPQHGAVLLAENEGRFVAVSALEDRAEVLLPLISRSECAPRAVRERDGVHLRLASATSRALAIDRLELVWVPHAPGDRVVGPRDDQGFQVLRDARLPTSIVRGEALEARLARKDEPLAPPDAGADELLPYFARQDAVLGPSGPIWIATPTEDLTLQLVTQASELTPNARAALEAELLTHELRSEDAGSRYYHDDAREAITLWGVSWTPRIRTAPRDARPWLELRDGRIDQVLWAHVARVPMASTRRVRPTALHTGPVERWTRGRTRPGSLEWPELDVRDDRLAALATGPTLDLLEEHDGRNSVIPPNQVLELVVPVPESAPDTTWTLSVRVGCDSQPPYEPWGDAAPSTALFHDVTRDAGIEFVHLEGPDEQLDIRPTMGPGAAWGDVDGDGWNDLFLPQGGGRDGSRVPTAKLYRNRGEGTFEDVTARANLGVQGRGMGALFLDVDGDGDLDLFVANYGANKLYLNDGAGRFTDVTLAAGLPQDERWHAAVSAADYDRDGDLDLYVTSYLDYDPAKMPPADELGRYQREDPLEMLPFAFPGERKQLLRNDRIKSGPTDASAPRDPSQPNAQALSFRFTDVTDELHVADANGRGMQAIFWDFDQDGDQDLYVANDVSPNTFYRNEGDGTWKDISLATGLDDPRGSMGLAVGDVDGDGDEDLFVTNWQLESNALYVNNLVTHSSAKHRVATFRDQSVQAGLAQLSVGVTSWGSELADLDLDGDLDLVYANGYTSPDYESTGICVGQPSHLFLNDGTGKFTPAFELAGPDLAEPLPSRCLLACDYDQDGDLDLAITANNARARLLRNDARVRGKDGAVTGLAANRHWLGLRLRARGANRFAIGAEVRVEAGGRTLLRTLRAGTSYLGGNAPELHVGLGDASKVDGVRVRWPDGKTSTHAVSSVDAFVVLTEPE